MSCPPYLLTDLGRVHRLCEIAVASFPSPNSTNEYIINQGETGTDLYMIKTGKIAVEVGGLGVVATMTSGQYFGDIALIQASSGDESAAAAVRTASIRAITYCELFVLTKEDVQYVWERNPGLRYVRAVRAPSPRQCPWPRRMSASRSRPLLLRADA